MSRSKRLWGLVAILAAPLGIIVGKSQLLTASPPVFAVLGMVGVLCLGGIAFGVREGQRAARDGRSLVN